MFVKYCIIIISGVCVWGEGGISMPPNEVKVVYKIKFNEAIFRNSIHSEDILKFDSFWGLIITLYPYGLSDSWAPKVRGA